MSAVAPSGLVPVSPLAVPEVIRNGSQQAKNAYATGLAFEQVLLGELSQELSAELDGSGLSGASSTDGSSPDGSGSDGAGIGTSDPAGSEYGDLQQQALSSAVVSAGGDGIAMEIARAIDHSILHRT